MYWPPDRATMGLPGLRNTHAVGWSLRICSRRMSA